MQLTQTFPYFIIKNILHLMNYIYLEAFETKGYRIYWTL